MKGLLIKLSYHHHLIPIQMRAPSPNGNVLNGCLFNFSAFENRSGLKSIGSGKMSGSLENAKFGIMTAVSLGNTHPFGNV